jgi:copper chaperone CopZ
MAEALRSVGGVREAAVALAGKTAMVVFDESQCGMARLVEAVRAAGFSISGFRENPLPPSR